jgi:hypothetical protein
VSKLCYENTIDKDSIYIFPQRRTDKRAKSREIGGNIYFSIACVKVIRKFWKSIKAMRLEIENYLCVISGAYHSASGQRNHILCPET